ncbi:MAG: molybdopterin-dependent oxidoreductase [Actinobacteria bacterium]|nr:molybdopterin-dependent oxidoreductase [Actinomycetota bacterium]
MGRKRLCLLIFASLLIVVSLALFVLHGTKGEDHIVVTYDEITSMPSVRVTYRSINNWRTVEETEVKGIVLHTFLEQYGIDTDSAEVRLIAPDDYFWPAVGSVLTLDDLKRANAQGLLPLLAWEMNGETLQPEPDGSGPLRLVMPQYDEGEINKPSWVSNLRLIEIGPLRGGAKAPDAKRVPVDELWIYGDVPTAQPFSAILPLTLLIAGLLLLGACIISRVGKGRKRARLPQIAAVALAVVLASTLTICAPVREKCRAAPGVFIFTMSDLMTMPSFAGHYTFLKSQEPFTYYEADYRGVSLSYLLEERLSVAPEATGVEVRARDGYTVSLTMSQVRETYPGGLRTILAYDKNGSSLRGDEGSLRLIVPQSVPGNKDQGGDANTPLCARMVYAVGILPMPAGERTPIASEVSEGSLAIYGAVSEPALPSDYAPQSAPSPQSGPQPSPQPTPENNSPPEAVEPGDDVSPLVAAFEYLTGQDITSLVWWMVRAPMVAWPLGLVIIPLARYLGGEG